MREGDEAGGVAAEDDGEGVYEEPRRLHVCFPRGGEKGLDTALGGRG